MEIRELQELFVSHNWTLSLAESCTGGYLSASITAVPGCSAYFLGSVVSYSNELKVNILGVDPSILAKEGAVSEEVVRQMAEGVLRLTKSDYSIAVSGVAGPTGGMPTKPIGTIWGSIASKHHPTIAWSFHLTGPREEIIKKATEILLEKLWERAQS